jgi:cysteine desulfurase
MRIKNTYYFDCNGTTPLHPEVDSFLKKNGHIFGNPSSLYRLGRNSHEIIEKTREQVSTLIHASTDSLIFTSGATEANNQVLKSVWVKHLLEHKPLHIISSSIEHSSIKDTLLFLEKMGVTVSYLPVTTEGITDISHLENILTPATGLITVMGANNETGVIQPIKSIADIAKKHHILFHCDAVQLLGKHPLNIEDMGVDFLSLSAHKYFAPKGVGVLYCKQPRSVMPLLHGGSQEQKRRSGTENLMGILGFSKALEVLSPHFSSPQDDLGAYLLHSLRTYIPETLLNGHETQRLSNTVNVSFLGISGEAVMMNLDLKGIAVSTGSACSTGSIEPSHVLTAMGLSLDRVKSAVRFSISPFTTKEDIDRVVETTRSIIKTLRTAS